MITRYKPIKLDDLAKKLKVSKVTVSKALRDHPDISPEMTKKVKDLADKVGYMPNSIARNLSSRKSNTIGLVVPKIAHVFFASVIESVYDAAFQNNYEIILTVSQEQAEREKKHILSLMAMRVDGIIISVTEHTKDVSIFKRVKELGVPLLFFDRVPSISGIPSVTCDDKGGAFKAIEYAFKKGYKKIAHLGGYHYINIGKSRYEGFRDSMNKFKLPINKNWVTEGGFGEEDGYNGFMEICKKGNLPEYVLAVTYPVALGMRNAAAEMGIKIPGDIEVTCFGKSTFVKQLPSFFNFVDQPTKEMGKEAFETMLQMIDNPKAFKSKNIKLKADLVINGGEK
jgi:LacI family transcriptional regulator